MLQDRNRSRRISGIAKHAQRRFNAIIRNEQLHTSASTFHSKAYTDDDGRYASGVQCDPGQIRFDIRRVALDGFHE
jgi:hypothetical protein